MYRSGLILLSVMLFCVSGRAEPAPKTIHVFVALCDNLSQGIVKVPDRIGNGEDPKNNLYWGAREGLKTHFSAQPDWTRIETSAMRSTSRSHVLSSEMPDAPILERCLFRHTSGAWLLADAYRGRAIETALKDFLAASAGNLPETLSVNTEKGDTELSFGGTADLVVYLGHNGLMDFDLPRLTSPSPSNRQVIVLCCKSEQYFRDRLTTVGASPVLLTTQFMYPGSFLLKRALDGWLKHESRSQIRSRVGQAYAANQQIGVKAALGVFSSLEE